MKLEKVYLIDSNRNLCSKWEEVFADYQEVEVLNGDYFQKEADAIVSPANSFGIMDGGLDLVIRDELGSQVESDTQKIILDKYHGEMPVGSAEIIKTNSSRYKHMVCAPTMRIPEKVAYTLNAYQAFRAVLIAINSFNKSNIKQPIKSLICSGLGTGAGGMSAIRCAGQMRAAYKTINEPAMVSSFKETQEMQQILLTI